MTIRTLQWNIGGGKVRTMAGNPEESSSYTENGEESIIASIGTFKPDIVTLQETHANAQLIQAESIANRSGLVSVNDVYDHSHLEAGQELGQAILSNFPIKKHNFVFFFNPHYELIRPNGEKWITHDKGLSSVELELPNGERLAVLTLHMVPFHVFKIDPRSEEAKPVIESAAKLLRAATTGINKFIFQGDFNLDTDFVKDFFPELFEPGVKEVPLAGPTTPDHKKIDHVLYKGLELVSSRIDQSVLTDHFPIISEFEL